MSTLKELLGGKWPSGTRVKLKTWETSYFEPIFKDRDGLYAGLTEDGASINYDVHEGGESWEIIKPIRKITLRRFTYRNVCIKQSLWGDKSWDGFRDTMPINLKLLKTETKEVEIDESM